MPRQSLELDLGPLRHLSDDSGDLIRAERASDLVSLVDREEDRAGDDPPGPEPASYQLGREAGQEDDSTLALLVALGAVQQDCRGAVAVVLQITDLADYGSGG